MRILMRTLGVIGFIHFLAQCATFSILQERHVTGCVKRKHPPFKVTLARRHLCLLSLRVRQSGKVRFIGDVKNEVIRFLQIILRKLEGELRKFLLNLTKALLLLRRQVGTSTLKTLISLLQQHALLFVQITHAPVHHRLHAKIEFFV